MKWHPDKNKNNENEARDMFLEVAEAYDVLCNKEKKAIYDQYGYEGLRNGVPDDAGDMRDGYSFKAESAEAIFTKFFVKSRRSSRAGSKGRYKGVYDNPTKRNNDADVDFSIHLLFQF